VDDKTAGLERMLDLTTGKAEYPALKSCSGAKSRYWLDGVRLTLRTASRWGLESPATAPI